MLSRRTVLRSAAWAAPVVTVVSAAPAFAASVQTFTVDYTSPRNTLSPFARRADFVVSNPTGAALVVTLQVPFWGPGSASPSYYAQANGWTVVDGSTDYLASTTVAPFSTSGAFRFEWESVREQEEIAEVIATAPGFEPVVVWVILPFDRPR